MFPIGYVLLSVDKDYNPNGTLIGTWQLLTAGYVLKTISSGAGGTATAAGNTGAASGNTGSTTLTAAQSGLREHNHKYVSNGASIYTVAGSNTGGGLTGGYGGVGNQFWGIGTTVEKVAAANATSGHTHTLNNHAHTAGMPANIGVYAWKRTA
jgi:hypothetical protein